MRIIIYSGTNASTISTDLGKAEYSYYFILRAYLPILETLGTLIYVENPDAEVDSLYRESLAQGEPAVFLSFSPPHRTSTKLDCPTVCILAWEFSSLPNRDLGRGEADDWTKVLLKLGNVITISQYSTDVIRRELGEGLHLATIPAPVTSKPVPDNSNFNAVAGGLRDFAVSAALIDTRELEIRNDVVYPSNSHSPGIDERDLPRWDGTAIELCFDGYTKTNNGSHQLVGFQPAEFWGAWARSDKPWISLPSRVFGNFVLSLDLVAYGENAGRDIEITIGSQTRTVQVDTELRRYSLNFSNVDGATYIAFSNLVTCHTEEAALVRALSIGVGGMSLESLSGPDSNPPCENPPPAKSITLEFEGLVYTSVFNPQDGRKNWADIVKAFCWAFRDDSSVTLILKLSCTSMTSTWGRLLSLFSQLNPFQCRIVVIHGYLSTSEMNRLFEITDYVVNASHAEGQCLPLLEFMAEGVPAIAPDHTAMASYIAPQHSFVVDSWKAITCWPQDEQRIKSTFFYNIDWASLLNCFIDSALVARTDPQRYREMAYRGMALVRQQYSLSYCEKSLTAYLCKFSNPGEKGK